VVGFAVGMNAHSGQVRAKTLFEGSLRACVERSAASGPRFYAARYVVILGRRSGGWAALQAEVALHGAVAVSLLHALEHGSANSPVAPAWRGQARQHWNLRWEDPRLRNDLASYSRRTLHVWGVVRVYDSVCVFFVHLFLSRFVIPLAYRCHLILRGPDIIGDETVIFGLLFALLALDGKAAGVIHRAIQP
jgi:hypothetical protein